MPGDPQSLLGALGAPGASMGGAAVASPLQRFIQDALESRKLFDEDRRNRPETHPADLPQGVIERLIKEAGKTIGTLVPGDLPYLEQYLHPDRDVLPRTPERPTQGTPSPLVHRLPSDPDRADAEAQIKNVGEGHVPPKARTAMIGGLGTATLSPGKDYMSVYDTWDFNSPSGMFRAGEERTLPVPLQEALDWIIKQGLQRVGTPFAVYERYPTEKK